MPSKNPEEKQETCLKEAALLKAKAQAIATLKRLYKRTLKEVERRKQFLQKCHDWPLLHHEGELLQSNLYRMKKGMNSVTVADWEQDGLERVLPLDPLIQPKDQVASRFFRSKKLRLGIPHAKRHLDEILDASSSQELLLTEIQKVETESDLNQLFIAHPIALHPKEKAKVKKKPEPPKPYRTYTSESGSQIWLGKSAKDNDQMTFCHAKGSDFWLHAHNYPGSHVVLPCKKGAEPDQETLKDAAELALRFSKAKNSSNQAVLEGEVTVTQVKYLTRIKGSPGKVQLSKHRVMKARLDPARWDRLRGG